ncbi:hypothetical protein Z945_2505 [Sulfitobacter noctilucae]|nr:hypothetical protein Z945_2505 [Sulfitobacter noctilucae]
MNLSGLLFETTCVVSMSIYLPDLLQVHNVFVCNAAMQRKHGARGPFLSGVMKN